MPQLDARQRAVLVHGIGHERVRAHVVVIPKRREGQRRIIGAWIDGDVAGAHDAPAAFGFGAAEGGAHAWHGIGHAGCVRHGIEAVAGRDRPDLHRLEEDVVTRVACHSLS